MYGLKYASFNWYEKLKKGLEDQGFTPSQIDPCIYPKKCMIVLTHVDDGIIIGNSMRENDSFIDFMKNGKENSILTDEGDIDKFLIYDILCSSRMYPT